MIGRQLIEALTGKPPQPAWPVLPLVIPPHRACPCDVDLAVFGHTQCQEAAVPWPEDPQAHPPL